MAESVTSNYFPSQVVSDLEKQSKEISNLLKFMKSLPEIIFTRLTGSGSCIFAAFESKILAEESLAIFNKKFPLIWSKVVENNFI